MYHIIVIIVVRLDQSSCLGHLPKLFRVCIYYLSSDNSTVHKQAAAVMKVQCTHTHSLFKIFILFRAY